MMDHSDILARVNSALTGIQLVLASYGTEASKERLARIHVVLSALAEQMAGRNATWSPLDIDHHEIGAEQSVAGGGGQSSIDHHSSIAPATPTQIDREVDADGVGQDRDDTQGIAAHPSATISETPPAQQVVQPADQRPPDTQKDVVGGQPIHETSPEKAAGGGRPVDDTHITFASPSTHPASNGGGRGHGLLGTQPEGAAPTKTTAPQGAVGERANRSATPMANSPARTPILNRPRIPLEARLGHETQIALRKLDEIRMPNGMKWGDCRGADMQEIIVGCKERIARDAFSMKLAEWTFNNVPLGDKVRDHLKTEKQVTEALDFANKPAPVQAPMIEARKPRDYRVTSIR